MFAEEPEKSGLNSSSEEQSIPAAITDTGCERELNEDRYAVIESASGVAWCVCDGMGGASGGELAAQLAIDAIRRDLENLPARPPAVALRGAILEANRIIVLRRQNPAFSGMGTTVVGVLFQGQEVVVSHAGDSRAYLVRDGAIQQLTIDHTYVQQLVDKGQISQEEAMSHPQAHVLTRCIGSEPGLEIDTKRFYLWESSESEPCDMLVLATDGLYSLVTEPEVAQAVSKFTPQRACAQLVEMAKDRGGFDNITVAVVPLQGQLRTEPPLGYEEAQATALKSRVKNDVPRERSGGGFRLVVLVVLLSGLAAVLTVLAVSFLISKS